MNLFKELWKQGKLASKRHPMFEKNKNAKIWIYIGIGFWACYLVFIALMMGLALRKEHVYREQLIASLAAVPFVLILDFLLRFPFQQTPTQEVKPYLLLPVHKQRIIDFLLIRSGLDKFNLFWFLFFVPFGVLTIIPYFGFMNLLGYLICIWLLIIINNYWFLLCKTLIGESIAWLLLPLALYGGIVSVFFLPGKFPVIMWLLNFGEGLIKFNLLYVIPILVIIALLWVINRKVMSGLVYKEINKIDDMKIKHLSSYKFLDRYGMLGEFFRLELKMLLRNRATKGTMRMIIILVAVFCGVMTFTPAYNDLFGKTFVSTYAFCAVGVTLLQRIMAFEGNYIDGLMVRKECILTLLKAKYYLSSIFTVIPFCLMLPAVFKGKVDILFIVSILFFTTGFVYFALFQLAVYNKETTPLNAKISTRQSSSTIQKIITFVALLLPLGIFPLFGKICGETVGNIILLVIGVILTATSSLWLRNIYNRFMKRRYANMASFHDSRNNV